MEIHDSITYLMANNRFTDSIAYGCVMTI